MFTDKNEFIPVEGNIGTANPYLNTSEYKAWTNMKRRCYNRKEIGYHNYGGRGISVCDRWRYSFKLFLADVGFKPSPLHTLDRYPNNDGNYEPGNVRWATRKEQANNRRNTAYFNYMGKKKTLSEWAEKYNVPFSILYYRVVKKGLPIATALVMPIK